MTFTQLSFKPNSFSLQPFPLFMLSVSAANLCLTDLGMHANGLGLDGAGLLVRCSSDWDVQNLSRGIIKKSVGGAF